MKRKTLFAMLLIAGCLSFLHMEVQGQGRSGDAPGHDPNGPGNSENAPGHNKDAPFDGGISLLVAAGAAYALKKAYNKKKQDEPGAVLDK